MATIKTIAKMAGVSRGTVDRVLNNRGLTSPETAEKIREIAKALNYTPNKAGKTLAIKRKNLKFGYIMFSGTDQNPFWADVMAGLNRKAAELEEYGVEVAVRFSEVGNYNKQLAVIDELVASGIKGLAITPINNAHIADKLRELVASGIPVVTVNSDIEDCARIAYVGSNYYQSGKTAGNLMGLFTKDSANVGIVSGSNDVLCHTERIAGFIKSISDNYKNINIIQTVENHDDDVESFSVTRRMLEEHPEIDALYLTAAGVYGACRALEELKREKKITVISFDTIPTTIKMVKSGVIAATIDQQPYLQGSKPLDILFNLVAMDIPPVKECFFTNIEIKIRENI